MLPAKAPARGAVCHCSGLVARLQNLPATGLHNITHDLGLSECFHGLKPVQTFNQHISSLAFADLNRGRLPLLQNGLAKVAAVAFNTRRRLGVFDLISLLMPYSSTAKRPAI